MTDLPPTPRDGEWTPAHYRTLARIQQENRCSDTPCVPAGGGHCWCMDQFKKTLA
ncbi:MAG: hypothetical protein ACRYHQ_32545 [Janthinobacterium lividum]